MKLTVAYITSREQPCLSWFFDSLRLQQAPDDDIQVIVVDTFAGEDERRVQVRQLARRDVIHTVPKPTIWQGKHRITSSDWWAAANARNTAMCLCKTEWIAFLDDRCVLLPGWLDGIRSAIKHGYAVCGSYEKVHNLIVENGVVNAFTIPTDGDGKPNGRDGRLPRYTEEASLYGVKGAVLCPGEWMFGCSFALPLEWALQINGQDETCDGLSMEDCIFGLQLKNNDYPLCYDPGMKMIEDRTPTELGTPMRREDKGVSPNDKSHAMLAMLRGSKRAMHGWDLRAIRDTVLAGGEFPIPEAKQYFDWYDGSLINGI